MKVSGSGAQWRVHWHQHRSARARRPGWRPVGVERVAHVLEVRRLEVDADLLHAAVPVGEDELARRVVGPVVVPHPRREGAQHLLVSDLDGHLEQPQRIGLGFVVVGAPEAGDANPDTRNRELRREERTEGELRESRADRWMSTLPVGTCDRKCVSSSGTPLGHVRSASWSLRWVSHDARLSSSTASDSPSVPGCPAGGATCPASSGR